MSIYIDRSVMQRYTWSQEASDDTDDRRRGLPGCRRGGGAAGGKKDDALRLRQPRGAALVPAAGRAQTAVPARGYRGAARGTAVGGVDCGGWCSAPRRSTLRRESGV